MDTIEFMYSILRQIEDRIDDELKGVIIEFIENNEWGLALETICDAIFDNYIPISHTVYDEIAMLTPDLLVSSSYLDQIKEFVKQ